MVGAFLMEIFIGKIPYLNMHGKQVDHNKITQNIENNIKYVIMNEIMLQGDAICKSN